MNLLSDESSNAKLSKNESQGSGYRTSILYLAPANSARADVNICPASTPGCRAACLYTAGRGAMNSVQDARIRKTLLYIDRPWDFMLELVADLERLSARQKRTGERQAIRLNGTSDIAWESFGCIRGDKVFTGIPQAFPELQFYDYTKLPSRAMASLVSIQWPSNYAITFSKSESNSVISERLANHGANVAIVFLGKSLPDTWFGRRVIDGTAHDMRFLDPKGVIVGLLAKGRARRDESGFAINLEVKSAS